MAERTLDPREIRKRNERRQMFDRMRRYRFIYVLLIPVLLYFLVFSYYHAAGHRHTFRRSSCWAARPLSAGELSGDLFQPRVLAGVCQHADRRRRHLPRAVPVGLLLALALNELRHKLSRSFYQTVSYIPNLLSWSVVGSIWITLLAPNGLVNGFLELFAGDGFRPIVFMSERSLARGIMIFTGAWKGAGYYAALFLAAVILHQPDAVRGGFHRRRLALSAADAHHRALAEADAQDRHHARRDGHAAQLRPGLRHGEFQHHGSGAQPAVPDLQRRHRAVQGRPASAAACVVLVATMVISFTVRKLIGYDKAD